MFQKKALVDSVSTVDLAIRQAEDLRSLIRDARRNPDRAAEDVYRDIVAAMLVRYPTWQPHEERLRAQVQSVVGPAGV